MRIASASGERSDTVGTGRAMLLPVTRWLFPLGLLLLQGLLLDSTAWALDPARPITLHDQRSFGMESGLPQTTVTTLAQTPDGYLWVGTYGGLARFDGLNFTVFRSDNTPAFLFDRIGALLVDSRGDLWVGVLGGNGLMRYRNGVFETFENTIIGRHSTTFLMQDRQKAIWFGAHWGVGRYRDGAFETFTEMGGQSVRYTNTMTEDGSGGLWLATANGLVHHEGGSARLYEEVDGESFRGIRALARDGSGGIWIGGGSAGLFHYDHQSKRLERVTRADAELSFILDLFVDRHHTLWAATHAGLTRLRKDHLERTAEGTPAGEPGAALFEDREGNLWFGAQTVGLVRIAHGRFHSVSSRLLPGKRVTTIAGSPNTGRLWVGTGGGGAVKYEDGVAHPLRVDESVCPRQILALAEDKAGQLWLGGEVSDKHSLCRIDINTGHATEIGPDDGFPEQVVRALHPAREGGMLVGGHQGLFLVKDDRAERLAVSTPTQPDVFAIHETASGDLLVGGWGDAQTGGIHRLAGGLANNSNPASARWEHVLDGLGSTAVHSIDEDDDGTMWIGTMSGFARYRDGKAMNWRLRGDPVYKILPDRTGDLWLCTPRGISQLTRTALTAHDEKGIPLSFSDYRSNDGLAADQCGGGWGSGAGWRTHEGDLWFVTGNTIAVLASSNQLPALPDDAIKPIIEEFVVDRKHVPFSGLGTLPPGRGDLEIAYTAPFLSRPERLRFRYRLDPFDADWVDAGGRRRAFYTQVPPGAYTFRVTFDVRDAAIQAPAPADMAMVIAPPYYMTWWFRGLAALLALALISGVLLFLHRKRVQVIQAEHRAVTLERTRIAHDLHDTLAQGFTGIAVQLEAATAWMEDAPGRARENIDKARALVRVSLADTRRAVWDLKPEAVAHGDLVSALSGVARSLDAKVAVRVQVNGQPRPLPPDYENGLVRIGQEALTNAIKHARAANVALTISFVDDCVQLKVVDDGRGFDPSNGDAQGPGHLGLEGIRSRARALAAELSIESRPGAGTKVIVQAPIPASRGNQGART